MIYYMINSWRFFNLNFKPFSGGCSRIIFFFYYSLFMCVSECGALLEIV